MTRKAAIVLFLIAGLMTGQAAHWFIGGEYRDHSQARNAPHQGVRLARVSSSKSSMTK